MRAVTSLLAKSGHQHSIFSDQNGGSCESASYTDSPAIFRRKRDKWVRWTIESRAAQTGPSRCSLVTFSLSLFQSIADTLFVRHLNVGME